jgi:pyruvate/2-oxoglutarate dehydrogenase complex dihydrolipoamide dehydrogenase (E3) component
MFARVGVTVTIVCRSRLLPAAEPEIREALSDYFRDEGIQLECGLAYRLARQTTAGVALIVTREGRDETLTAERILVAAGRAPNVEGLGLAEAGVAQETDGNIQVDERMRIVLHVRELVQ